MNAPTIWERGGVLRVVGALLSAGAFFLNALFFRACGGVWGGVYAGGGFFAGVRSEQELAATCVLVLDAEQAIALSHGQPAVESHAGAPCCTDSAHAAFLKIPPLLQMLGAEPVAVMHQELFAADVGADLSSLFVAFDRGRHDVPFLLRFVA